MEKNFSKKNVSDSKSVTLKERAGIINLRFYGKRVFTNKKKNVVTVETAGGIYPRLKGFKHIRVICDPDITSIGVAKCSENDNFNDKAGYLIASSRAENNTYLDAINYLKSVEKEALAVADAAKSRIELLRGCISHNKEFINNVAHEN